MGFSPTPSSVHVNRPLTNVAQDWKNAAYELQQFVMPTVTVQKESDTIFRWDNPAVFRSEAQKMGVGAGYPEVDNLLGTQLTYTLEQWGAKAYVYDRIRDNADSPLRIDTRAAIRAKDKVDLAVEIEIATLLTTAGNWTPNGGNITITAGNEWNSSGGGDPIGNIDLLRDRIHSATAKDVTVIAMNRATYRVLQRHPQMLALVQGGATTGNPAKVTRQVMAEILEIPRIVISETIKVTSAKGVTDVYAHVFPDGYVWMGYVTSQPSLDEPSAGYVIRKNQGVVVKNWRDEEYSRTAIAAMDMLDPVALSPLCGGLITGALTS